MSETPVPRRKAPELEIELLDGTTWRLSDQEPENFTMLVFYRGLHCPVCKDYLQTLTTHLEDYRERGVDPIAVSMDHRKRAEKSKSDWNLGDFPIGHSLDETTARSWGLYLSNAIKESEPDLFSEPGLFLVKPDGDLYYAAINSMPFGRPHLPTFLKAIDFVLEEDYPSRGEVS